MVSKLPGHIDIFNMRSHGWMERIEYINLYILYLLLVLDENDHELWSDSDDEEDDTYGNEGSETPPDLQETPTTDNSPNILVKWLLTFFLLLQAQFHLVDRLLGEIFSFLKANFLVLGRLYGPCAKLGQLLPATVFMARKFCCREGKASFEVLPVCKQCGAVWKYNSCIEGRGRSKTAKLFPHVDPLDSRRRQCNGILLKTVELASGKTIFYPLMTYCYIDLQTSLQHLLLDQNFTSLCSHWKSMDTSLDKLEDVYDGRGTLIAVPF